MVDPLPTSVGSKPRIKEGAQDPKRFALFKAACPLLAQQDYEQISVAKFASAAGISVGAFYERFEDKDSFLGWVVSERLNGSIDRMEQQLDPERWRGRSPGDVTQAILLSLMECLHGPGDGVFRAALKRGFSDQTKLKPLLRYRTAFTNRAVALLAHRAAPDRKEPDYAVRSAVQMAEATALDALLHKEGTLRPASWGMVDTLRSMMLSTLGLPDEPHTHRDPQYGSSTNSPGGPGAHIDMPIEQVIAVAAPDPQAGSIKITQLTLSLNPFDFDLGMKVIIGQEEKKADPPTKRGRPRPKRRR
jgi:AcrR family transcriptional regulator